MKPDYGFIRRPTWLIGHLIAISAIVLFVNLGLWQVNRHDERGILDDRIAARIAEAPTDLDTARSLPLSELELRQVTATGAFDTQGEVVLLARSFSGRSGHNVLTPLVLDDGSAVIVNRGWIPIEYEGPPVVGAEPPLGTVTVVGVARLTEVRRGLGPVDPAEGTLERISRVDLDRLGLQSPHLLEDYYLQLVSPGPADGFPLVLDIPEPGGGPPHLSYAMQWFAFAGVVAVGYPILLRSTARKQHGHSAVDSDSLVVAPEA